MLPKQINLDRKNAKMSRGTIFKVMTAAAWASIAVIAYATLTHVGFVYSIYFRLSPILMRPQMRNYAHFEHLISFRALGRVFSLACPRRPPLGGCTALGGPGPLRL